MKIKKSKIINHFNKKILLCKLINILPKIVKWLKIVDIWNIANLVINQKIKLN